MNSDGHVTIRSESVQKSNQTSTNHVNHETKHLQAKITYKIDQTCLYKCGSKFTIQKRWLDQNTLRDSSIEELYKRIFKLAQLGNKISQPSKSYSSPCKENKSNRVSFRPMRYRHPNNDFHISIEPIIPNSFGNEVNQYHISIKIGKRIRTAFKSPFSWLAILISPH